MPVAQALENCARNLHEKYDVSSCKMAENIVSATTASENVVC